MFAELLRQGQKWFAQLISDENIYLATPASIHERQKSVSQLQHALHYVDQG